MCPGLGDKINNKFPISGYKVKCIVRKKSLLCNYVNCDEDNLRRCYTKPCFVKILFVSHKFCCTVARQFARKAAWCNRP